MEGGVWNEEDDSNDDEEGDNVQLALGACFFLNIFTVVAVVPLVHRFGDNSGGAAGVIRLFPTGVCWFCFFHLFAVEILRFLPQAWSTRQFQYQGVQFPSQNGVGLWRSPGDLS